MQKKSKVIFCLILLFFTIIIPIYSLSAGTKKGNVTSKQITEAEFEQYDLTGWTCTEYTSEVAIPTPTPIQIPNK